MLTLEVKDNGTELAPGALVQGRVGWQLPKGAKVAALRLFWYTEGRGDQDVGIASEQELPTGTPSHEELFEFALSGSPYSFSGHYISLRWALELVIDKGKEVKRVDMLVSPWVEEVKLSQVEEKTGFLKITSGS